MSGWGDVQRGYRKSLYLLLNFDVNQKIRSQKISPRSPKI